MFRSTSPQAASVESCISFDSRNQALQIAFQHTVKLQRLPRGNPQGAVTELIAQIQMPEQLRRGQLATGDPDPHHEAVLTLALHAARWAGSLVTIVLLIDPVMLQQLDTSLAEIRLAVHQFLRDRARQVVAFGLHPLDRASFVFAGHRYHP